MRFLKAGLIVGIFFFGHIAFGITQQQRIEKNQAKAIAEEDAWAKTFAAGGQWIGCPEWVKGVYVDPKGNPWFEAEPVDEMKKRMGGRMSLERVRSGKSRVIRGEIERVDRAGRSLF